VSPPQAATIYTVAAAAGVSIASVSRVLQRSSAVSDKTRTKVLEAAARLNYVPLGAARSLAVGQHEAHGLVLPALKGPYYSELLVGFEARAAELGQSVVLALIDVSRDPGETVRALATRTEGLAVHGSVELPDATVTGLSRAKPLLVIGCGARPGIDAVGAENTSSARDLTAHLMGHGRRRLLFLGAPHPCDIRDRYEGFRLAHVERGIEAPDPVAISFEEADGVRFAQQFLAGDHEADGVVCANDEVAVAILDHLTRSGVHVPDDLAITGWDDVMAARYVRPGLTTVRQPVREIGELAATRLYERVTGAGPATEPVVLPTELVLRGSCGCPDLLHDPSTPRAGQQAGDASTGNEREMPDAT
jgi:LacI family transcriptional regulator